MWNFNSAPNPEPRKWLPESAVLKRISWLVGGPVAIDSQDNCGCMRGDREGSPRGGEEACGAHRKPAPSCVVRMSLGFSGSQTALGQVRTAWFSFVRLPST